MATQKLRRRAKDEDEGEAEDDHADEEKVRRDLASGNAEMTTMKTLPTPSPSPATKSRPLLR
jgi:hypothetical protein